MEVRIVHQDDLAAVEALYARSVRANTQGFIQDLSYHGDIKQFAQQVTADGGLFAVGEHDGEIIAMGALRVCPCKPGCAELCKLHVEACKQGCGCGRKMCEFFIEQAPKLGLTELELHVTTSQQPAVRLYKKLGFAEEKTEVWQGTIGNTVHSYETLYMRKKLAAQPHQPLAA